MSDDLTIDKLADIIEDIAVSHGYQKPVRNLSVWIAEHTLPFFIPEGGPIYLPPKVYELAGE